jgi:subtilisin family serine protease
MSRKFFTSLALTISNAFLTQLTPVLPSAATIKHPDKCSQQLIDTLMASSSDAFVRVELKVYGAISGRELTQEIEEQQLLSLDERRRYGLRRLREIAERTQGGTLALLTQLKKSGAVHSFKSHWLTNTISAELTIRSLDSVLAGPEVVSANPKLSPVPTPIDDSFKQKYTPLKGAGGVESNLTFIGADSAWRMGVTGKGRIVCVFDGNVKGDHPALINNWKGLDGDTASAFLGSFPGDADDFHGTHILGIMIGHDDATGDTIGVAPDARWIYGNWYDFEWAADPDQDPNTTSDMPDVANMSIDMGVDCWEIFWDYIEIVEALDMVVPICAGNRGGTGPYSVSSPASRADDSLTNFAVGSVDHNTSNVWWSSSRGPSRCDSVSVKPNITAPGAFIRSAVGDSSYEVHGGTSMAAPHVAGAVALLRQYSPNATAREIKEALLAGAVPRGGAHPNNDYGWGILNIPRSLQFLGERQQPDFRVSSFEYPPSRLGDTISANLAIVNYGHSTDSVFARIDKSASPGCEFLVDSIYFGKLMLGDTATSQGFARLIFDDTIVPGQLIPITFAMHGTNGWVDTLTVNVRADIEGDRQYFAHRTGRLRFTMSNFGHFGHISQVPPADPICGFCFNDTTINMIEEASLIFATDSEHVSDCLWSTRIGFDDDFWVSSGDSLEIRQFGDRLETECRYGDGRAESSMGLAVTQKSFTWSDLHNDNFVILEFRLSNTTTHAISGLRAGVSFEWKRVYATGYVNELNLGYMLSESGEQVFGIALLNDEDVGGYRWLSHCPYCFSGFTEGEKFEAISGGLVDTAYQTSFVHYAWQFISTVPFDLAPKETKIVAFAALAGNTLAELKDAVERARTKWRSVGIEAAVPTTFEIFQNYPNPFNPNTNIHYYLSENADVSLSIFNILGQNVRTLVDESKSAGSYFTSWDGKDSRGRAVASGVYLCTLHAGSFTASRKMLLVK